MDEESKRKTTTSSAVKNRYNYANYMRKTVSIRKDSELAKAINEYDGAFTTLVLELLTDYFGISK